MNQYDLGILIKEGKELAKIRPIHPWQTAKTSEEVFQQNKCYQWFLKGIRALRTIYPQQSEEISLFISFYNAYIVNDLETKQAYKVYFLKDEMEKQIAHLQTLKTVIEKNQSNTKEKGKQELNDYIRSKKWKKPFWWSYHTDVKKGFCPICTKPITDVAGNIPGIAFEGGICINCRKKLRKYNTIIKRI